MCSFSSLIKLWNFKLSQFYFHLNNLKHLIFEKCTFKFTNNYNFRTKSSIKCSRKDSRKVYDESTNTECACEVCGKQWPAKKHLWQHLIRFHRAEAAVTCGVCLKLCKDYDDLAEHLKAAHEAILSTEGNNFTCKICGRYYILFSFFLYKIYNILYIIL